MYLGSVDSSGGNHITEALWDTRVSSSTISKLNHSVYEHIEKWRSRPIEGEFPYVYLDGVSLKRRWGGEVGNVSVLIAIGVGTDGHRRVLGVVEGAKEDKAGWGGFLRHLKSRGLSGVQMFISDACLGRWRVWEIFIRKLCGSAALFISIGTCSVTCLGGRWRR